MNIYSKLPDDIKYKIMKYVIITPSAKSIKPYLGWYKNYLKFDKNKQLTFIKYYFTKLYNVYEGDRDLFISVINYKLVKKTNSYCYRR